MQKTYKVDICGREESLPIMQLPSGIGICFFNLHGNVELTEHCAKKLAERVRKYAPDVLLTAESKGLQLTHCIARELKHGQYAVARKSKKLYMQD
ncbi:MAG: adenine phosphoribosyltransferase, partial [Clostridiales bacterium]|nr:adenine phosphoribosyltransferase [Clostridiales bacterium]